MIRRWWRRWRTRKNKITFGAGFRCDEGQHPSFRFLGSPPFAKQCIVCGLVVYFDNLPDGVYGFVEALRTTKHNPVDAALRFSQTLQRCSVYCEACGRGVPEESLTARNVDGSLMGCPYCGSNQLGDRRSSREV